MTVEFLDPPDDDPIDGAAGQGTHLVDAPHRGRTRVVDAVLSAAGAVLLVVACFQTIYSIGSVSATDPDSYRVDGWGRLGATGGTYAGQHTARIGIVLCVCAGLAMLGLLARVVARHGAPARSRLGTALGFAAGGGAVAVIGGAVLDLIATRDNYRAALAASPLSQSDRPTEVPSFDLGGFVWLAGAGALCILAASTLAAIGSSAPPLPVDTASGDPGDDELGSRPTTASP